MDRDMQDFSPLPAEYAALPPEIVPPAPEITPEGVPQPEEPRRKRRKLRFLLYAAAALVYLGLLFRPSGAAPAQPVGEPQAPGTIAAPVPGSAAEPQPTAEPEPEPTPEPEPLGKAPVIETVFFSFSHEHHGWVYLSNTGALHSVEVQVRDKVLGFVPYDAFLSEEEIASGRFELPMVSTGELFEAHMDEYYAAGTPMPGSDYTMPAWPEFEMVVTAWYESEDGTGEDTLTLTAEPEFELGFGMSYWRYDWDEQLPQDSFLIVPWEGIEELTYVFDDPDAVTDPTIISVDVSCNGRHVAPEEYETVLYREEYSVLDSETGEYVPTVGYTKELVLPRPDWMPEEGTLHVVIVQRLASTGELWTREFDFDYSV